MAGSDEVRMAKDVLELPNLPPSGRSRKPVLWANIDASLKAELDRLREATGLSQSALVSCLLSYAMKHAVVSKTNGGHGRD